MNKLFDILLRIITATILGVAVWTTQSHNYYVFLHWFIFISSIYFAYRTKDIVGIWGIRFSVIFFSVSAILFNPFMQFTFPKTTWRIIDMVLIADILLFLKIKEYAESLSQKGKLIYNLIKQCTFGITAMIAAIWFLSYNINANPYHEYQLITESKIANGFITNVEEYKDEVDIPDAQGGGSEPVTIDIYDYNFTTQDGKVIKDRSSDLGYMKNFKNKPLPIQVEYLPDNPKINRVKDETSQCKTLGEFIWRKLGLGGLLLITFCSIGFAMIRNAIKEYITERKKLIVNFQEHGFEQTFLK